MRGSSVAEGPAGPGEAGIPAGAAALEENLCSRAVVAMLMTSRSAAAAASPDIHRIRSTIPIERVTAGPPCRKAVYGLLFELAAGLSRFGTRPLALRPRLATGLP